MSDLNPKIYVACLSSYNAGILHGEWIDASQDVDSIVEAIHSILASSPIKNAEEWAIHAYEEFGGISIDEHENIENVTKIAEFVLEYGELGAKLYNFIREDIDEATRLIKENYHGAYESEAEFVRYYTEEINPIPTYLEFYIDYEKMARDWFICDFFSVEVRSEMHVFSHH